MSADFKHDSREPSGIIQTEQNAARREQPNWALIIIARERLGKTHLLNELKATFGLYIFLAISRINVIKFRKPQREFLTSFQLLG